MSYKKIILICFCLMVVLQLWTPAAMIWNQEAVLKTGKAFKFRSAPVDPNDPFRGKYINLSFDENTFKMNAPTVLQSGENIYVLLSNDSAGYAKIISVQSAKPNSSTDFIKAKVNYFVNDSTRQVFIEWPFNRFYMDEAKAYDAEKVYVKSAADSNSITYALVKVKNGEAVLENVFINDKPIASYIKK